MFNPRTEKPTNKYFNRKPSGYSNCLPGKGPDKQPDSQCNILPDNFGYIQGRFNEIASRSKNEYFTKSFDIQDYFNDFETGSMPRLGAVAVFEKNHNYIAGIVEFCNTEWITLSYSIKCGLAFNLTRFYKEEDNWVSQDEKSLNGYQFKFFMYHPDVEQEIPQPKKSRKKKSEPKEEILEPEEEVNE